MSEPKKPIIFGDFFTEGQYFTEVETLAISEKKKKLTIGVPCETILSEKRVALVPSSIRTLVGYGHEIIVESGAGQHANFSDHHYSEAGATISHSRETVFKSQVIVKIAPPTTEEIKLMQADQVLISPASASGIEG